MSVAAPSADLAPVAAAWAALAADAGADYAQAFAQQVCDLRVETQAGASGGVLLDRRAGLGLLVRRGDTWSYAWADLADTDELAGWLGRASGPRPAGESAVLPPVPEQHRLRMEDFVADIADDGAQAPDALLTEELFGRWSHVADTAGVLAESATVGTRRRCTVSRTAEHGDVRGFGRWYGDVGADRAAVLADVVATATRQAEAAVRGRSLGTRSTPVVLDPGVGGALVHELLAHGLEADNHRRPGAYLADRMDHRVAPRMLGVTDDPAWAGGYGSLDVDDEGTPARRVQLVAEGTVTGLLHSRRTATQDNTEPTGHGRRRDYRHPPVPRATNTVVAPGPDDAAALAQPGPAGLLHVHALGSGSVDTRSGAFQFMVTEADLVSPHGDLVPLRDVMIRGGAEDVLGRLAGVADDLGADNTTCSKDGQYVGVGTVSPTMLFDHLEWRS